MGTVAWAKVATGAHTDIGNWDASKMCADSEADQMKTVVKTIELTIKFLNNLTNFMSYNCTFGSGIVLYRSVGLEGYLDQRRP